MDYGIVAKDVALVVVEFLKVLAWPTVVLVALCLFRTQINSIFRRLKNADFGGVSLSLMEEAGEISEKVDKLPEKLKKREEPSTPLPPDSEPSPADSKETNVLNNAKAQIEFSWADLEDATLRLHQRLFMGSGGSTSPYTPPKSVVQALSDLYRNKMVDSETLAAFRSAQKFKDVLLENADDATFETYSRFLSSIENLKRFVGMWDQGML